jgi:hypothetical protein
MVILYPAPGKANADMVVADRIVVIPQGPLPSIESLTKLEMVGTSIDSFTILDERLHLFGSRIAASGDAHMEGGSNQLHVSNIGSSGQDGVSMENNGDPSTEIQTLWSPLPDPDLPSGAQIMFAASGEAVGLPGMSPMGTGAATKGPTSGMWDITADFSPIGASTMTVELLNGGTVVASASGLSGLAAQASGPPTDWHWEANDGTKIQHGCTGTWGIPVDISLPTTKSLVSADAVHMIPEGDAVVFTSLTTQEILLSDIPEITIEDLNFGPLDCCANRGDINHDGVGPDISDLVALVDFMFGGGEAPPCLDEADINGDGVGPDISDLVALVDFMFGGGAPPVPCGGPV